MSTVRPKPPTLTASPTDSTIRINTRVTLTCSTASQGSTTYSFYKNSNLVLTSSLNTYTLDSVATSDNGVFSCVATINSVNSVSSPGYTLTVVGKKVHLIHGSFPSHKIESQDSNHF